ncbi:tyrosine-protein phosphatase non-receptor type 14 isoform X2 [Pseudophryne corroboree]|uniref:tyrosine-protein phosphatase non-receptor type 14 isoform X2 n=1 Tax=Pseudophryne corroboree TaxID=495146 RepID=UPI00308136FF
MPFKLTLRRTKRYNVLSKSSFVSRIRLLNSSEIECNLSVDSTGLECLEAVALRLELCETHYFGLWFIGKSRQARWVELGKSLKKQLDKFSMESLLYFGVMFYVPSVSYLNHSITRYQYYLQLRKDVFEGRLHCTVEQYIRLAALAVQVESKDYTLFETHDFLRNYMLFPAGWVQDQALLEELYHKVVLESKALSGMPPEEAEVHYIKEVEVLDGYGQECFHVKDSHGNDVTLHIFFMGIFTGDSLWKAIACYRWNDIGNITHNKSAVVLELNKKEESVLFHTDDIENSKYISRLFAARLKFYKVNKICTEPQNTPPTVRRQHAWSRSSVSRQPSSILPPRHIQGTETYMSEDSIFHMSEDTFNCRSQNSLDRYMELNFMNGTLPNGSVSSAHSMNSLNHSQNFIQASPMSSNLSITGNDIMRSDYIPKCRHSAIIVPSYRQTPDYETVMRQKNRSVYPPDSQSQSLRNLNIGNTHAYRHRENLVYSQPEIQERPPYMSSYGPQPPFGNKPVNPSEQTPPGQAGSKPAYSKAISHTVSTPELANVPPQTFSTAHMFRNFLSRPPPPYPPTRPASSTPDLASHRHKRVSSSSPDLVTRKVQQSVKTFQEDSAPVVRQSLQEVSEPLKTHKHHPVINKRHSFEVMSSMVRGMEVMALKSLIAPLPRRNTLREQLHTEESMTKSPEVQQLPMYHHKKNISDATMLIHSSDSEEEDDSHKPAQHAPFIQGISYSAQLQAALARIPNKPPPEYPGPRKSISNGALRHDSSTISAAIARAKAMSSRPSQTLCMSRNDQPAINGTSLGPSISEPDLTSVKERVKREPVKERPVSEMFSTEDAIVEREIMMRNLQKQEVAAQKRPLMLAALNGLSVSRIPVPEDRQDETVIVPMDERCKALGRKLEEGMVFTEYEQIPKRKADGVFTTATLPENVERNRVREVIPYEENRVELVPTKENHTGYINASHIKVAVGDKEWHYIATQGPLPHTFHDFWQMVWEQGVNVIAMLTSEEEDGRAKSHRYWPKLGSRHNSATYGKFKVTTNFRTDSGCYATTGLKIKHLLSGQERTVWHLQFTDWPDHGCPEEVQGFLSYLEEIQSVRRHANSMLDSSSHWNPPVLVHCSAGVGRSGVVILSELMMRCLEHNEQVEIPVMLKYLREQRMFMIQTIAQYKFVYQVLIQFLESSRLI